eukprot:g10835.t1
MFAKGTEINHNVVLKKLNEILQARGKKGTDRYIEAIQPSYSYSPLLQPVIQEQEAIQTPPPTCYTGTGGHSDPSSSLLYRNRRP